MFIKTQYYKEMYPFEIVESLENTFGLELTDYQKSVITRHMGRTFLYKTEHKKVKSTFLMRLTYPLFLIWCILVNLTFTPFKWLFTGTVYYKRTSLIYKFTESWAKKLDV